MPTEVTDAEIEAALALIQTPRVVAPGASTSDKRTMPSERSFEYQFRLWAIEFDVNEGKFLGETSGNLYRHWRQWMALKGREPLFITATGWGRALSLLGLRKGRDRRVVNGRVAERRAFLLPRDAAAYFRKWAQENPGPGPWPELKKRGRHVETEEW